MLKKRALGVFVVLAMIFAMVFGACGEAGGEGEFGPQDDGVNYKVGDKGPGGGIIFYVHPDPAGFTVEGHESFGSSYPARYLEAAPEDSGIAYWQNSDTVIIGVTTFTSSSHEDYNKIGNGRKDTLTIVEYLATVSDTGRAAQVAAASAFGGQDDWFLPSRL